MYTITYLVEPAGKVALLVHVQQFNSYHRSENVTNICGVEYVTLDGVVGEVDKDRIISIVPYVHRARTRKISG